MVWNPADFGGIEQIVVRAEDVWTPDILLYNRYNLYRIKYKYLKVTLT